jgi:ParB-like chromosome segregation protein Spo0J
LAEIRKVKLSSIDSNPFRDEDEWPTLPAKVAEIRQSYRETGFWDGYLIVRPKGKRYEAAFGHHRLVAAREEYGEGGSRSRVWSRHMRRGR